MFEDECAHELARALPDRFLLIRNLTLPRGEGLFFEYDIVVVTEWMWEVVEAKCIRPVAKIYADAIVGADGFTMDRAFSRVDTKAKHLRSRRKKEPFPPAHVEPWIDAQMIHSLVVVPGTTTLRFQSDTDDNRPRVFTLPDLIQHYESLARGRPARPEEQQRLVRVRNAWQSLAAQQAPGDQRSLKQLGRYLIGKKLPAPPGTYEFLAYDTYPCKIEVHLKEVAFDHTLGERELRAQLDDLAREMKTLRRIRHPSVACVIGHFSTGASLVQVSDWFEGHPIEENWQLLREASPTQRVGLCCKVADALAFCHERGVFHRNVSARSVLVSADLEEVRVTAFGFARDLDRKDTLDDAELARRDNRLLAPEETLDRGPRNARLTDIYQAGVLFYRIMEAGHWPFEQPLALGVVGGEIRPMESSAESGVAGLEGLLRSMVDPRPQMRPDPMRRVESTLRGIAANL